MVWKGQLRMLREHSVQQKKLCTNREGGVGSGVRNQEIPQVFVWAAVYSGHRPPAINDYFGAQEEPIPTLAAARLQRWAILLLGYQYELEFRPSGQHSNADGFSRLPRPGTTGGEKDLEAGTVAFNLYQIEATPLSAEQLREATRQDPLLSMVLRYTQGGWPREVPERLQPYHQRRSELGIEAGCLFWGTRVVVPGSLQSQVLTELHAGHTGIVRMKGVARAQVWWPRLGAAIEQTVYSACQGNRKQPPTIPLAMAHSPVGEGTYRLRWPVSGLHVFGSRRQSFQMAGDSTHEEHHH